MEGTIKSDRFDVVALEETLQSLVWLKALEELVTLLLLAALVTQLKPCNVLQNMFMYLVLNVDQWLCQKILYVDLVLSGITILLTGQGSQILQKRTYFLRSWIHLLEELNNRFHETLCLAIELGGPLIELGLVLHILKSCLLRMIALDVVRRKLIFF